MKCPHCGFEHNKPNEKYCYWCDSLLEQKKNSLGLLKQRLDALKLEFHNWCIDLGEFCIDRKHSLGTKQAIVRDFALWLSGIAGQTVPLAEMCNKDADERKNAADNCNKVAGDRKKFFRLPTKTEIWAFYAGIWFVLIVFWLFGRFAG